MKELVIRIISFVVIWQSIAFVFRSYNKKISRLNKRVSKLELQNKLYVEAFQKLVEILDKN